VFEGVFSGADYGGGSEFAPSLVERADEPRSAFLRLDDDQETRPQAQSRYEDTVAAGSPVGRVAAQFGGEDAERLGAPVPLQEKRTFSARQAPVRYPVRNGPTVVAVSQRPESGIAEPLDYVAALVFQCLLKTQPELGDFEVVPDGAGSAAAGPRADHLASARRETVGVRSGPVAGVHDEGFEEADCRQPSEPGRHSLRCSEVAGFTAEE